MSNPTWVSWHPGLELTANHLFALEDYLIERNRLIDQSFGVIDFNWQEDIVLDELEGKKTLIVKNIQGITRGGYPVRLDRSIKPVDLNDQNSKSQFGLWVKVNVFDENEENDQDNKDKQQVHFIDYSEDSDVDTPNLLYLGCYEIIDRNLVQINKPIPHCMLDLKPNEGDWHEWCSPLAERIKEFREYLENFSTNDVYAQTALKEFVLLSIEWPMMPVNQLTKRLIIAKQVADLINDHQYFDYQQPADFERVKEALNKINKGDELLHFLVDLLGDTSEIPLDRDLRGISFKSSMQEDGELYKVETTIESQEDKVYLVNPVKKQTETLVLFSYISDESLHLFKDLMRKKPGSQFVWPSDLVHSEKTQEIGYIRPTLDTNLNDIEAYFTNEDSSALVDMTIAINLIQRFVELHKKKLYFSHFDTEHIFIQPDSKEVLICYKGNIVSKNEVEISGNTEYLPPEANTGGIVQANLQSDLHFLACLIFRLIVKGNPFINNSTNDFYGLNDSDSDQVFRYEDNDENKDPKIKRQWSCFPDEIREKIKRCFKEGLSDPLLRVHEESWLKTISFMRDSIVYCGNNNCGIFNFYFGDDKTSERSKFKCSSCGENLLVPHRLYVNEYIVVLNEGAQIFPHHVGGQEFDFSSVLAKVEAVEGSKTPNHYGLRNLSNSTWSVNSKGRKNIKKISPGSRLNLQPKYQWEIDFGGVKCEIKKQRIPGE